MSAVVSGRRDLGPAPAFWLLSYAFLILFVGTTIPTPLYRVYQEELHFSSGILTLIFAVYVLFLLPSLLVFGRISDRIGRRTVLLFGFTVAALAAAIFAGAQSLASLFVERALQGIATGVVAGAGTAALLELEPNGNSRRAAFAVTVANASGAALGPLFAGLFAEYGPWPTQLPFIVYLWLMLPIAALALMPETVLKRRPFALELRLPAVPHAIRTQFAFASAVSFTVWAAAALYLTLAPSYVAMLLGLGNLAVGGAFVSLMLLASAAAQFLWRGLAFGVAIVIGLTLLPIGLASHRRGPDAFRGPSGRGNAGGRRRPWLRLLWEHGARQQARAANAARRSHLELLYRLLSRGRAAGGRHRVRGAARRAIHGRGGILRHRELDGAGAARHLTTVGFRHCRAFVMIGPARRATFPSRALRPALAHFGKLSAVAST